MGQPAINIESLSPSERLDLIERLWNSLHEEDLELTDAQRAELDRRNAALDEDLRAGRELGRPWAEARARIEDRRKPRS